jgi:uncharacterized protein involved in exopolysaccharide biosynthesis
METQSQLKANELEIANRERDIQDSQTRIEEYRRRLNEAPIREQQFSDLSRDYEQSRSNYNSLLAKSNQSDLATSLEKRQEGEQFRLMNPPTLPQKPDWPNRPVWSVMGVIAGLALGLAATALAELLDDHVHNERDIKQIIPGPILIDVPLLTTTIEFDRLRRRKAFEWCAGSALLAIMTLSIVATYCKS